MIDKSVINSNISLRRSVCGSDLGGNRSCFLVISGGGTP